MQSYFLGFRFCLLKKMTKQPNIGYSQRNHLEIRSTHHEHLNFTAYSQYSPHTQQKLRGGGRGNIVVETIVKAKIGELEEEIRE